MEGVIIQTERVYRGMPVVVAAVLIVALAGFLTWFLLSTIRFCKRNKNNTAVLTACFAVAFVFCGLMTGLIIRQVTTIHNDLIVTIDDSVGFNEFSEHYEIVSRDGNLYAVRELEIEEIEHEEAGDNE